MGGAMAEGDDMDGDRHWGASARRAVAAALAATALGLAGCAGGAGAGARGERTLVMGDNFSLTHPMGRGGTEGFVEGLRARGGEVGLEVEYYASGQLGKQWDMPTMVRTGVADIAVVSPSYVASEMPLSSVGDLPGLVADSCQAGYALRELLGAGGVLYEEEFRPLGLHPLWVGVIPAYEAMAADIEIAVPEDLRGSVQRSTGGAQDRIVEAVGAAGVAMPIGDLYEALTRGTVEGTVASPVSITPYGLEEVIWHSTKGANLGSFTSVYVMNEDTWRGLDGAQRELVGELADEAQQGVCEELNRSVDESYAAMAAAGVEFVDVTPDQATWEALLEPTRREWVRDLESIGRPAGRVLEEFTRALARNEDRAGVAS